MDDVGVPRGGSLDWEGAEDLTAASERDLRARIEVLCVEERALDYRREVLRARIDLMRGELVRRGLAALPPEELAQVLLGDSLGDSDRGDLR